MRVMGDKGGGATDQGSIGTNAMLRERVMIDKGQGATDQGIIQGQERCRQGKGYKVKAG